MRSFCKHFLLSLIFVGFLQGCGGGGGTGSPPINLAAGVYTTTANGAETWAFLAPTIDSQTPNWYAINFASGSVHPDLYSAFQTGVGTSASTVTVTKHFLGTATTGNVSMTMPSTGSLSSTLTFSDNSVLPQSWVTNQLVTTVYDPTQVAANLSALKTWSGTWYFGNNTSALDLQIASNLMIDPGVAILGCKFNSLLLNPVSGFNVYKATLTIAYNTTNTYPNSNCLLSNSNQVDSTYQGLAFLLNQPAGKTTLYIMVVGGNQKGLFFKGIQP